MSGGTVTVADMVAVLRARDELSPVVRTAATVSTAELGKMQAAVAYANAEVKALQKQWLDYANAPALQGAVEAQLGETIIKAEAARAKMADLKKEVQDALRPPPEAKDLPSVFTETTMVAGNFSDMVTKITERLLIYASIRGVLSAVQSTVSYGLEIERLSQQLGMGTDRIQEFQYASVQTAIPVNTITQAITQMQRKIDLQDGGLIKGLADLGIQYNVLRAMRPEDAFDLVAGAIGKVTDQERFAGDAAEIFNSRSGASIAAVLRDWEHLKDGAHDAGVVLDREQVDTIARVAAGWETAKMKAEAYFASLIAHAAGLSTKDADDKPLVRMSTLPSGVSPTQENLINAQIAQQTNALIQKIKPVNGFDAGENLLPDLGATKQGIANLDALNKEAQELTASARELEAQNRKNQKAMQDWLQAADDLAPIINSSAWDGTIQSMLRLGGSVHDVAVYFDGASGHVETMTHKVEAANREATLLQKVWTLEFDGKPLAGITSELQRMGTASNDDIALAKSISDAYADNSKITRDLLKQDADYQGQLSKTKYDYERQRIDEWQNTQEGAIDYSVANWTAAYTAVHRVAKDKYDAIALDEQMALIDMHAQELTWSNEFQKMLADIPTLMQRSMTGGGGFSGFTDALFSGIGADMGSKLFAAGGPLNGIGNSLTGTMRDTFGESFGNAFGMALPGIGTAIGALLPQLFDLFQHLFGGRSVQDQVAQDIAPMFGGLSDAIQKQIVDSVKDFGGSNYAAMLAHLGDIAKDQKIDTSNLDAFMAKTKDIFSMITQGHMTVAQASTALDSIFPDLATAATDSYGRISDKLKDLIKLNDQYGTGSKEIATFLQGQGSAALDGFSAVVAGMTKPIADAQKSVDDIVKSLGSGSIEDATKTLQDRVNTLYDKYQRTGPLNTTDQAAYDDATKQLGILQAALKQTHDLAGADKQMLSDLGVQAVASFAAAVASGKSESDALKQISPALTQLQAAYKSLGLDVNDVALKSLMMRNSIMTANPELMGAIEGLSSEMTALDNMGLLNVKTLEAMERTGVAAYDQLKAKVHELGGTDADALGQMQKFLHQAEDAAKSLGQPLDDNTQSLIDQSKQLGIWQKDGGDATKELITGMQTLVDKVGSLIDRLNGVTDSINNIPTSKDITITTHYVSSGYRDGDQYDNGGNQAFGGDYLVTRPTTFVAGDAGPERVSFSGGGNTSFGGATNDDVVDELQGLRDDLRNMPEKTAASIKTALAYAR